MTEAAALPAQGPLASWQWRRTLRRVAADPVALLAALVALALVLAGLLAPWITPADAYATDMRAILRPPGTRGLLGTDQQGRDMVARLLFGLRTTLLMGLAGTLLGAIPGALIGLAAAVWRPVDATLMRLMDVLLSFPAILFGLAIAAILGPGLGSVTVAVAVSTVPLMARIVRGSALVVMRADYIEAARAVGVPWPRLVALHVVPNCASAAIVFATLRFGQVILLGSALSFLGLGAQPPIPELGAMAAEGRNFLFVAPHIAVLPCLVIFVVVLAFNLLGDAARDLLDPRLRT